MKYTLQNLLANFDERFLFKSNVAGDPAIEYVNQPNIIQDTEPIKQFFTEKITKLVTEACGPMEKEPDIILTAEGAEIMGTLMSGAEGRNKMRQQILSVLSEQ